MKYLIVNTLFVKLPKALCDDVKMKRNFVWGDSGQSRKAHLFSCETCCLTKVEN